MDCGLRRTSTDAGDGEDKDSAMDASQDFAAAASRVASTDVSRLAAMRLVGSAVVAVSLVADLLESLVVRTSCSEDSTQVTRPTRLAVVSCEVIVDASIDVRVPLKLQPEMDPLVVLRDAADCYDSGSLDDLRSATVVDARKLHQLMDAPRVTFD
jgi:hypothetical protein